jgi:hypothetical protein
MLTNNFTNLERYITKNYTINSANTWEQKTITVDLSAGIASGGTWNTTNGEGLALAFMLGANANRTGNDGLNTWATGGSPNYSFQTTGCVNLATIANSTFYLTGVQLEIGSTATPFERRLYNQELANCQRYYELLGGGSFVGRATNATSIEGSSIFCVTKRASPTMTFVNGTSTLLELSIAIRSFTSISGTTNINGAYMVLAGSSGLTSPNLCIFYNNNAIVSMSAEL